MVLTELTDKLWGHFPLDQLFLQGIQVPSCWYWWWCGLLLGGSEAGQVDILLCWWWRLTEECPQPWLEARVSLIPPESLLAPWGCEHRCKRDGWDPHEQQLRCFDGDPAFDREHLLKQSTWGAGVPEPAGQVAELLSWSHQQKLPSSHSGSRPLTAPLKNNELPVLAGASPEVDSAPPHLGQGSPTWTRCSFPHLLPKDHLQRPAPVPGAAMATGATIDPGTPGRGVAPGRAVLCSSSGVCIQNITARQYLSWVRAVEIPAVSMTATVWSRGFEAQNITIPTDEQGQGDGYRLLPVMPCRGATQWHQMKLERFSTDRK